MKGVAATFMALREGDSLAWGTSPHPGRDESRGYAFISLNLLGLPVALFFPWIGTVVVAALLPETRAIMLHKLRAVEPVRARVGIEFRYEQAYRAAVIRFKVLSIVFDDDHDIIIIQVAKRQVGCIARPGMCHHKLRARQRPGTLQNLADMDTFPCIVVAAPTRHTVKIGGHGGVW